jgi:multidrug resistance efflux pump
MQHKLPPVPVRILLVLILLIGGYYAFRSLQPQESGDLAASGTIEATVVNVSPELAGKVKEVLVK